MGVFSIAERELKLERLLAVDEGCGIITTICTSENQLVLGQLDGEILVKAI